MANLVNAILSADFDLVKTLVEQGADVHYNNSKPILAAFKIQDKTKIEPIVKFLVEQGASVDGSSLPFEDSPFTLARRLGLTDLFKWLDENRDTYFNKIIEAYKNRPI